MADMFNFADAKKKAKQKDPGEHQFTLEVYHDGTMPTGFITSKPEGLTQAEALRVFADQLATIAWNMRTEAQTLEDDPDRGGLVAEILIYQKGVRTRIDVTAIDNEHDKLWLMDKLADAGMTLEDTLNDSD